LVNGASSLCIRHDDITKPLPEEEKKFFGNYANAHLSLFQNISNGLKDYSNFNFFFVPMHYQGYRLNSSIGKSYLEQIGNKLPQNVFIFWTGPTTKSKNIQQKDFQRFSNAIKRNPVLWDNTIYAHNGKYGYHRTLSCYLFDLFSSKYPQDFYKTTEGILYNGGNGD
jgi:hyaluronoglucosaminidase